MASPAAVLAILVKADTASATASLMRTDATLKKVAASSEASAAKSAAAWQASGKKMQSVGRTLTTHVSLPIIAAGGYAIKSSLDFNKAMTLIQTQAGASAKEVERMREAVLKFGQSGKTAFSPEELAKGLYAIESAGIRGAKALATLKRASDLAIIGQTDLESTTKALAAAQKTGIRGSGNLKKAIGTLNATVGSGQMHMEDLVGAMGTGFLASAARMGLSLRDVGGALAELTKQGMPATQAATRLRMAFSLMAAPSDSAKAALKGIGLSSTDLANAMRGPQGILGALQMLQAHLDGLSQVQQVQVLSAAFGGGRSSAAILGLLGNLDDLDKTLQNIDHHAGDVNQSLEAAKKTKAEELQIVWAQLQATLVRLGDKLIPIVIPALEKTANAVIGIVNAFNKMPQWAVDFLIGAVVLGPFIRSLGAIAVLYGRIKAAAAGAAVAEEAASAAGAGGIASGAGTAAAGSRVGKIMGRAAQFAFAGAFVAGLAGAIESEGGLKSLHFEGLIPKTAVDKSVIPEVIQGIIDKFGSLRKAAKFMDEETKKHFLGLITSARDAGEITERQWSRMTQTLGNTTIHWGKSMARLKESTSDAMKHIRQGTDSSVNAMVNSIQNGTSKWDASMQKLQESTKTHVKHLRDNTVGSVNAMVNGVNKGYKDMQGSTNRILQSLGVQKAKFMAGPAAHPAQGGTRNFQRGGLIPGSGDGDKVPVMAEPGEGFINKKAVRALGGSKAIDAINQAMPRFARGGNVKLLPGVNMKMGQEPTILQGLGKFSSEMGKTVYVISGYRSPAHSVAVGGFANDPHTQGKAADIGLGAPTLASMKSMGLDRPLAKAGLTRPFYPQSATEANHVQLLHGAAAGKFGAAAQKVARILLRGPKGALRDMGQGALDKTRAAANRYIAEQVPKFAVGSAGFVSGDGNVERVFASVARKLSTSKTATLALGEAGFAESGMRDLSYGDASSQGALQLLASTAASLGVSPHNEGAIASLFFTKGFYGRGGANKLAAQGLPAYLVAQGVQGSADASGSNYRAQEGAAKAWMRRFGLQKGGVVGPYVGSFAKGGQVAETGLAHVHKGETVVPGMQRGGIAPTFPRGLIRALRQLVHLTPAHDRQERRAEMHLLQRIARASGPRQLNLISKALDKFGVNFTKAEQKRLQKLARQQRHGGLTHPQHRELHHLRQERRASHEQAHIRRQIEVERELLTEFKQLRSELKEHNRLVKSVRVNEKAALNAVVNLTSSQIGAQGLQKTRNASPGRAARY